MFRPLIAAASIAIVTPAAAQPDDLLDDRTMVVLEGAREALRTYETLSFDVEFNFEGTGQFSIASREANASVILARTETGVVAHIDGHQGPSLGRPGIDILAVRGGSDAQWLDHEQKQLVKAYGVRASRRAPALVEEVLPREIFGAEPFRAFETQYALRFEGVETVGGVDCDVLAVTKRDSNQTTYYAISRGDRLLRRAVTPFGSNEGMEGSSVTQTILYENHKLDAAVSPDLFTLKAPAGYTVTRSGRVPTEERFVQPERLVTSRVVGTEVGNVAPAFSVTDTTGTERSLEAATEQGRTTVLVFWSSWHPRCQAFNEELTELHDELDGGADILALAVRERDPDAVKQAASGLPFAVAQGARDIADAYAVRAVPTVYVINGEGEIILVENRYEPDKTASKIRDAVLRQ